MQEAPSEHQETFFTIKMTQQWHSLARLVVKSTSLEVLKSQLDMMLGNSV